jgi:hypothetical protein
VVDDVVGGGEDGGADGSADDGADERADDGADGSADGGAVGSVDDGSDNYASRCQLRTVYNRRRLYTVPKAAHISEKYLGVYLGAIPLAGKFPKVV